MDFITIIRQIIMLFIVMTIGAILGKKKILNDQGTAGLSKIIIYVSMPAMILSSLSDVSNLDKAILLRLGVVMVVVYSFLLIAAQLVPRLLKVKKRERGLYVFMVLFGNVGFIGYPMLLSFFGNESVFIGALFNIPYNILLYTVGIMLMAKGQDVISKKKLIYRLVNPGVIVSLLCFAGFLLEISLPDFIMDTFEGLGKITSPAAMLIVGKSLSQINIRNVIADYKLFILCIIKMIGIPLIIALIFKAIGLTGLCAAVGIVLSGMPIGTTTVIMANEYNRDNIDQSFKAVTASTISLLLTAPILVWIISIVL